MYRFPYTFPYRFPCTCASSFASTFASIFADIFSHSYSIAQLSRAKKKFESNAEAQSSFEEAAKQKKKYQKQLDASFLADKAVLAETIAKSFETVAPPKTKRMAGRGKRMSVDEMIEHCEELVGQLSTSGDHPEARKELAEVIRSLLGLEEITQAEFVILT